MVYIETIGTAATPSGRQKMDMTSYNTADLKNAVDMDKWAVIEEAHRRAEKAAKAAAKARKALARAEAEIEECAKAMNAAHMYNPPVAA